MTQSSGNKRRKVRPAAAQGSGSLYERYKDALRRGHVAALRGRNEAAVDAYGEAASIAPDRALPHVSIGGILVKMNRLDDAIASYERAIALAPRDEGALRGLADVHVRAGQRSEAAAVLDRLADSLDAAGRLADATDAARRALELAESRSRRQGVEGLAGRLRASSPGDEDAQRALDQALRLLAPPAPVAVAEPEPAAAAAASAPVAELESVEPGRAEEAEPGPGESAGEAPESEATAAEIAETAVGAEPAGEPEAAEAVGAAAPFAAEAAEPEPETEPEPEAQTPDEPIAEPVGLGIALGALAETALFAGDPAARDHLLAAARAHRRAGRTAAALDACDLAIGVAPSDYDVHLLLADLYLDRGWRVLAVDKLLLLARLADLDEDGAARDRLCAIVTERLADEPRVASLCA